MRNCTQLCNKENPNVVQSLCFTAKEWDANEILWNELKQCKMMERRILWLNGIKYINVDQFLNILDDLKTLIAEYPPDIIVILMKQYWNPSQPHIYVFIKYSLIFSLYKLYW